MLAAQFESFRDPFIILAGSVPLAITGALLFSFLGFTTLNIYSQVGLITLVGLVSKNGILIAVEFANHLQEEGREKLAAIVEAASTRLRPILDDHRRHSDRAFSARSGEGSGSWRKKHHWHHACERHDHRNLIHPVRGSVDLCVGRAQARATGDPRDRRT